MSILLKNYFDKVTKTLIAGSLLATLIPPAAAQNGVIWADTATRRTQFRFLGDESSLPQPLERSETEMVTLFKQLCLDLEGDPEKINDLINKPQLGNVALHLVARSFTVPSKKNSTPVVMQIWQGPGIIVYQTSGDRLIKKAQCNVRYYANKNATDALLNAALEAVVGKKPINASSEFDKKGQPEKYYSPQWIIKGKNNKERIITVNTNKENQNENGVATLFSIELPKKASK
jgi:hypothetical protein